MLNLKTQAAASNGKAAVLVGVFCGQPVLVRYAPQSIGDWENRAEFVALCDKATKKLGFVKRRNGSFRRVEQ